MASGEGRGSWKLAPALAALMTKAVRRSPAQPFGKEQEWVVTDGIEASAGMGTEGGGSEGRSADPFLDTAAPKRTRALR